MENKEVIFGKRFATKEEWEKMFEDYYNIACGNNYIATPEKHSEDRIMVGRFTPFKVFLSPYNKKDVKLFKTLIHNKTSVTDEMSKKNKDMITKVYNSIVKGNGNVDLIKKFVMNIGIEYELYQTGNDFRTLFARYEDKCGDSVMYIITYNIDNNTIMYENVPFDEFISDYVNGI